MWCGYYYSLCTLTLAESGCVLPRLGGRGDGAPLFKGLACAPPPAPPGAAFIGHVELCGEWGAKYALAAWVIPPGPPPPPPFPRAVKDPSSGPILPSASLCNMYGALPGAIICICDGV
jgi:hypothetical protein